MLWAWAMSASPLLTKLYAAPGNGGIADLAECVALDVADHDAVAQFCEANGIDFVVVGPEVPLVAGISNDLETRGIKVFGPSKAAAQLEGSKAFTKDLCARESIPTARYRRFTEPGAAKAYVEAEGAPIVIKADGLAAGKGVTVAMTEADAIAAIEDCFSGSFGAAGAEVVIEDCLVGEEASFFALVDGNTVLPLVTAQDHKRVGDGDKGPNTRRHGCLFSGPCHDGLHVRTHYG